MIALFLGASIGEMNLGSVGYGLLIGWVLWLIALIASIELFNFFSNRRKQLSILLRFLFRKYT